MEQFINIYRDPTQPGPTIDPGLIILPPARPYVPQLPVCIIGAGVSGLYIAMMLDSLGIKYELMETQAVLEAVSTSTISRRMPGNTNTM